MKKNRSIRTQMVWFFSILLVVPLLVSAVYVYVTVQNNLKLSYARHQGQTAEALATEIEKWRTTYEDLSFLIFGDASIQQYLSVEQWLPTVEHLGLRTEVRNRLVSFEEINSSVRAIYVMNEHSQTTGRHFDTAVSNYFKERLTRADAAVNRLIWDSGLSGDTIVLLRPIVDNRFDLNRRLGSLLIVLERQDILDIFRQFELDEGQQFALFDSSSDGIWLSTSEQDFVLNGDTTDSSVPGEYRTMELHGETVAYFTTVRNAWTLLTWIPEQTILKPIRQLLYVYVVITIFLLLFSISMVFFISHRITKPLLQLKNAMKQLGGGIMGRKVPVQRNDEIGQVSEKLNLMSDEIVALIEKNREEEVKRRVIQLRTLEYQINPHFLYNALDSVNMLARKYDDSRIADIVTSLSRLFRIGLNQGKEIITVSAEIDHVSYYLRIQGIRFGDQLSWDIHADEEIKSLRIIKFLLQPLVENSIVHGIRKRHSAGKVSVRAYSSTNHIILEVTDDGAGMTTEQLAHVKVSLEREEAEESESAYLAGGFGLRNVHQRIKLHYGPDYGVDIDSLLGAGTTIRIRLPKEHQAFDKP